MVAVPRLRLVDPGDSTEPMEDGVMVRLSSLLLPTSVTVRVVVCVSSSSMAQMVEFPKAGPGMMPVMGIVI